jgi:predicted heme/steroid binding protein/uncharacterized membrane protein
VSEKTFTRAELAAYDGQQGRPAYVAFKGRIIDVTASTMWRGGSHMKRHRAGQDLTEEIASAPHDVDVLDRFPQVGVLAEEPVEALVPAPAAAHGHTSRMASNVPVFLRRFLDRYPFFLRHPHPMTVHFPIVFFIAVPVFTVVFLVTGNRAFETTALHCLAAALLFSLVVIPTGLFTWWVNYGAQPNRAVTVKIVLSLAQFVVGLAVFLWRLLDPEVARHFSAPTALYLLLVFLLLPMIVVVAWYGATLTFPLRREKRQWRRRNADPV